jgi:hypothetical protein
MPPERVTPGRASKACTACRRAKTRCYASEKRTTSCLRCETLGHQCSLATATARHDSERGGTSSDGTSNATDARYVTTLRRERFILTVHRLNKLERAVDRLLERLGDEPTSSRSNTPIHPLSRTQSIIQSNDASEAPVMIIRDLAAEAGAQSPDIIRVGVQGMNSDDIVTGGLLSFGDAVSLLTMYVQYGKTNGTLGSTHKLAPTVVNSHAAETACCS